MQLCEPSPTLVPAHTQQEYEVYALSPLTVAAVDEVVTERVGTPYDVQATEYCVTVAVGGDDDKGEDHNILIEKAVTVDINNR